MRRSPSEMLGLEKLGTETATWTGAGTVGGSGTCVVVVSTGSSGSILMSDDESAWFRRALKGVACFRACIIRRKAERLLGFFKSETMESRLLLVLAITSVAEV